MLAQHWPAGSAGSTAARSRRGGQSRCSRLLGALLASFLAPLGVRAEAPPVILEVVATGLGEITSIANAGDSRVFVSSLEGQVWVFENGAVRPVPFLDIRDRVFTSIVQGLLGIAFHPDYQENGFFFAHYISPGGDITISRFRVSTDPDVANRNTEKVLLRIPNPIGAHNGGQLAFGPDGYLYVTTGDGGGLYDPLCSGQSGSTLRGKVLRLDVDQQINAPPFYGIPAGNPFAGPGDPLDEIWAWGLRNPWRATFDRATGDLFIADVGQDSREEVNFEPAGTAGGRNYGWKVLEGTLCLGDVTGCSQPVPGCTSPLLTPPAFEYPHAGGDCSVTGGYVYRGLRLTSLTGGYLYGDYCSGRLRAAFPEGGGWRIEELPARLPAVTTFGERVDGEVLAGAGDTLYLLVPSGEPSACVASDTRLCLAGDRFSVTARWTTPQDASGDAHGVELGNDSGYFWFFNPDNAELFVKLKDACVDPFQRFWFFAAGLTNVRVDLTVVDHAFGHIRRYTNPLGTAFAPVQDTAAFDTCS